MGQRLDHDVIVLLHDVARLIRVEADKRARLHGLTLAQWKLLMRLEYNAGLSQKEVADLLEVEPISVARLVDRLEASGLIERRPDAEDRRIWRLHLRPTAASLLQEIHVQRAELEDVITKGMSVEMRETMLLALQHMKSNLTQTTPASAFRRALDVAI